MSFAVAGLIRVLAYGEDRREIEERMARRSLQIGPDLVRQVAGIVEDVRQRGDEAILDATERWDSVRPASVRVEESEVEEARKEIPEKALRALRKARDRIAIFNRRLLPKAGPSLKEIAPGIAVGEKFTPLSAAGLWVPCRKAPLASTMLMLAVPATTAGVKRIVASTPPLPDGRVDPVTLVAAEMAGVSEVVRGNGVALIGAMAFGTRSVPRVEAIYGPGPPAVMAAQGYVGIYGIRTGPPQGPSECMILADDSSDPAQVALDLLNECEHGPDSSAVLVTNSPTLAERAREALDRAVDGLVEPRRDYVRTALAGKGMVVLVGSEGEATDFINEYAPEHLQIALGRRKCVRMLAGIRNAGEILLGQSTPFSAANYAMGITAVLPTGGSARSFSGVTARDYIKSTTLGRLDPEALPGVCRIVEALGEAEGLPAHVQACLAKLRPRHGEGNRQKRKR